MTDTRRLALSLFGLRLGVFVVMFMWTLDKLVNPAHAHAVFERFYGISELGSTVMMIVAAAEMALILAFLGGMWRRYSYGAVMILHALSTFSSYGQYFAPWQPGNLLFFAAWPMLAACVALYLLRDADDFLVLPFSRR